MLRKSQALRDMRARILIWVIIFFIGVLALICFHPFTWQHETHVTPGSTIVLESTSDFLIIVDYSAFNASPGTFADMSFSLAWLNTFQQEVGPVSLADANMFINLDLAKYRCVILTKSVAEQGSWTPKLRNYLERGGTVIMEMPGEQLRTIASADGKGGIRTTQSITFAAGLENPWMEALASLNISNLTQLIGSAGPLDDSQTFMTIDGVPVIYAKKYATGHVITLDFDYGMLLTSLQQGRPMDDFMIRNMRDSNRIETSDLAQPEAMTIPVADVLERYFVYGVVSNFVPVVGFWPFFDGMDGAVIMSHRENGVGDPAVWMAKYENSFKATSTLFAKAPLRMSDDGLDDLEKSRCELGLLFDLDVEEGSQARDPVGLFKFSPVWRIFNVEEQAEDIKGRVKEHSPLLTAQSMNARWTSHYTQGFQIIATAGLRADASYQASPTAQGYAFSTGLPFMPLDTNGLIFNIMEFPVMFPDVRTPDTVTQLETLLKESSEQMHEAVGIAFDADFFSRDPNVDTFIIWQSLYQIATNHKHWITSIFNYFRFSRARLNAEIKSRTIDLHVANRTVHVLRLETLAPEMGMNVTVPKTMDGKTFAEARRGLQRVREDAVLSDVIQVTPVTQFGFERVIVPLSKGFNAIDVIYE